MADFRSVDGHFLRSGWNETWEYPAGGSLMTFDKEFPLLGQFYFSFETTYQPLPVMTYSRRHYWFGPAAAALYLLFIYMGPKIMANRKPFDLRTPLKYWNLFLAIFSFWGMIRVVPQLFLFIARAGFSETLCIPPVWGFGSGAAGLWTVLFVYSKYFELIDTVFIILRKKELSFLHWYHHSTVLLYTWDSFILEQPPGVYYCAMNYTVHATMYFYFYLAATRRPRWGKIVTILQITQMFFGVAVTFVALYYSYSYPFLLHTTTDNALKPFDIPGCYLDSNNLLGGLAMYSTYFYLFAVFFIEKYRGKKSIPEKMKKVA